MGQLVKYEFGKIVCKKMVYGLFLFLIFFHVIVYFNMGVFAEKVVTEEGEILEGVEAIRYMQEFGRQHGGELTDEKVAEVYGHSYFKESAEKMEGEIYSYLPDIIQYMDQMFYDAVGMKAVEVAEVITPEMGEIHLGYHKGYAMWLFHMSNVMLVAGCVIVIAVAPVFAEEYVRGTDALVLAAKYGKTLAVRAKVSAAFLFSILLWAVVVAANGSLFLAVYGMEGWDTSVQVDFFGWYREIPYEMNYAQLVGYAVLMWLVACLLLTGITLVISACCKTAFAAVVLASACYVVPVWFPIPGWSSTVMPAYQMLPMTVLNFGYLPVLGQKVMPLWIVAGVSVTAAILSSIGAERRFAGL